MIRVNVVLLFWKVCSIYTGAKTEQVLGCLFKYSGHLGAGGRGEVEGGEGG